MTKKDMSNDVLVCSTGQGGHAISAYAALRGNAVTLYSNSPHKAEIINNKDNIIDISGRINGKAKLEDVISGDVSLQNAVLKSDKIIIVSDATAHPYYAQKIAPCLSNQDIYLISPGIGGALEFNNLVKTINPESNITVSETDTLVYACKVPEIGTSVVKDIKNTILYSTVGDSSSADSFITQLYSQFKNVHNPLMGFDDSPVFHIVGMVKNSDRIANKEDFNFYLDGITPEIAEYMEQMDSERCDVAKALGITPRSINQWLHEAYGVEKSDLYTMIQNTPPYQNTEEMPNRSPAPTSLFHRYLLEEIPLRAVPTSDVAKMFNIPTPKYDEMIEQASSLTGIPFRKSGRTIADMGLSEQELMNWKYLYSWD